MESINKNYRNSSLRNVVHLGWLFFFAFTAYTSLVFTQSSINFEEGLGTISLSVIYATYAFSSLFVAPPLVAIVKPKWSLLIGLLGHTLYIIANFYPTWITLLIASGVLGFVAPLIWISQGTYLNNLAKNYSAKSSIKLQLVLSKFNSVFFAVYSWCNPIGNLIAAVVLARTSAAVDTCVQPTNNTIPVEGENGTPCGIETSSDKTICGPNHCPYMEEHLEVLQKPHLLLIYILMSILLLFNVIAIVLCLLLPTATQVNSHPFKHKILSTLKLTKKVDLWLLMPMPFFLGVVKATIVGSFTQSIVSCTFGIAMVGYVMMAYGIAYSLTSLLLGVATHCIPRPVLVIVSATSIIVVTIISALWTPTSDKLWAIIGIVTIYGSCLAVNRIQSNALTSLLFIEDPEAAFGHNNLWNAIGHITVFIYSSMLCYNVKAFCAMASTCIMMVGYILVEIRLKRRQEPEVFSKYGSGIVVKVSNNTADTELITLKQELDKTEVLTDNYGMSQHKIQT